MKMRRIAFTFGVLLFLISNISLLEAAKSQEKALSTISGDYLVKTGDILDINVWKNKELNMSVVIDEEGQIDYPFLGVMDVNNKTVKDIEKMITAGLNKGYVVNPRVSIQLNKKSLAFFVYGEIKKPGSYKFDTKLDLLKAIILAGGLTNFASTDVVIIRKDDEGKETEIKVNLKQLTKATDERDRYAIEPGDTIIVKRSWF